MSEHHEIQVLVFGQEGLIGPQSMERRDTDGWRQFLYWSADASPTQQELLIVGVSFFGTHTALYEVIARHFSQAELAKPTAGGCLYSGESNLYVSDWTSEVFNLDTSTDLRMPILRVLFARDAAH